MEEMLGKMVKYKYKWLKESITSIIYKSKNLIVKPQKNEEK